MIQRLPRHTCAGSWLRSLARAFRSATHAAALTARNPAVGAETERGALLSPGLAQRVILRSDPDGDFLYWEWPGLRPAVRGAPAPKAEVERMCPAHDIERAAHLIANVVRLRDDEPVGGTVDG